MRSSLRLLFAVVASLLLVVARPASPAAAHAALVRSDPPAGATLDHPPGQIRMWFAEPLETTYTGADLLDSAGNPVPGTTVTIAPEDHQELILSLPPKLPNGAFTVAWRTLSAADGHTMPGYFGFRIGSGTGEAFVPAAATAPASDTVRTITRGLALIGLAALLGIAPVILIVVDPITRMVPAFATTLPPRLRRYAVAAAVLALLTSVAALVAEALAIGPGLALPAAVMQTLTQTRYGQLWWWRLLLLALTIAAALAALWIRPDWRRRLLLMASLVGIVAPVPFSLLSHAAAGPEGQATAVATDATHLLAAAIWGGGLFLLAIVLLPALRCVPGNSRGETLRAALARFSFIGLATWAILVCSGLYAAWLQVGTLAALRETPYGQSLLLKGAILLPTLALAAWHLVQGWRGLTARAATRVTRTVALEALLVIAVLLVVGRLIGQEPARTVLASQQPTKLAVPLAFATPDGSRQASLTIAPGATGVNTFTLTVDGAALPDGSEGVLRFTPPNQDLGGQELRLPQDGQNQFATEGAALALPGEWQLTVIVRKIGAFSWQTQPRLSVSETLPPVPQVNPAPRFASGGVAGVMAMVIGLVALAIASLRWGVAPRRRWGTAAVGVVALIVGTALLAGSRLPGEEPAPALAYPASPVVASPAASPSAATGHNHTGAASEVATPMSLTRVGTPVSRDGLMVKITAAPTSPGPNEITVEVRDEGGTPLSDAHVVLFSEMAGMGTPAAGITAEAVAPGRYVARDVPLTMSGDWKLTVRVSPKGEATRTIAFAVSVP